MDMVQPAASKGGHASSITVRCCVIQQPWAGTARTNQIAGTVQPLNSSSLMCLFSAHKEQPMQAEIN